MSFTNQKDTAALASKSAQFWVKKKLHGTGVAGGTGIAGVHEGWGGDMPHATCKAWCMGWRQAAPKGLHVAQGVTWTS